ncbi:uncharacterized protein [Temnothorax nylanderi]|uniref:uncharacterized protein n=1 Tax=Temnothorax nylanderi TaxID=102681 RepID=UPI003A8B1E27
MDSSNTAIWKNPRPSSTRFCRPIRVQWLHETDEVSKAEEAYLNQQIDQLKPYESKIGQINFSMHLTMVDGKVCNALSNSSAMCCYICGATPKEMNFILSLRSRSVNTAKFRFGLSVLHAHIRFFECLLHIAYRLDVKTWKVSKTIKPLVNERKKKLQDAFREKMGLLVDIPKPGFGTSNDGNTARRFFKNPKLSAEISGIDENLIRRFGVILKAMSAGLPINVKTFEVYCLDTAETYVKLYNWYYMPASVHKILIHGPAVIQNFMVPIGQLSEEAAESKNKEFKFFWEYFTRKSSRENTNADLFNRLLLSSDPLLSTISYKNLPKENKSQIDPEINNLLLIEENQAEDRAQQEGEDDDDDCDYEEEEEEEEQEEEDNDNDERNVK